MKTLPEAKIKELRKIKVKRKPGLAKLTHIELHKLYEQIFKYAPIGIYTINKQGYIDSFNPKMCELAGAKNPRQVIGLHALTLPTYKAIDLAAHIKKALEKEIAFDLPHVSYISYTAGKKSIRHFRGVPIKNEKGKAARLLMLVEDVTLREKLKKRLERYAERLREMVDKRTKELAEAVVKLKNNQSSLRRALFELKRLSQMKSEFISSITHQLRAPLSIERWSMEMLLAENFGKLSSAQKTIVNVLYQSNLKLILMLENLIEFITIETEKISLKKEKIDLASLIWQCREKLEGAVVEKNLTFDFPKPEERIILRADSQKLGRVVEILISNAVQYSFKNGKIIIDLKKTKKQVLVSVTDTGIGISKEDLPKIGTKFFRAKNAFQYDPKGLGVGLYIAQKYLAAHKGRLRVESEGEGRGSTFYFILPLK